MNLSKMQWERLEPDNTINKDIMKEHSKFIRLLEDQKSIYQLFYHSGHAIIVSLERVIQELERDTINDVNQTSTRRSL